jgi:uncharacterized DUF497 family protein
MKMNNITGFDWDDGNKTKCQKHGVPLSELESVFYKELHIFPDLKHSQNEDRYIALGITEERRHIFVAFTLREIGEKTYIRPISSRYMHPKEIDYYEKEITRIKNG